MRRERWRRFAAKKRGLRAQCSLCAQDIRAGERLWYRNGLTVCTGCFARFAREELRPFEQILGEEREE